SQNTTPVVLASYQSSDPSLPSATIHLDVDVNSDGTFSGSEVDLLKGTAAVGQALPFTWPTLALGQNQLRARLFDFSGKEHGATTGTTTQTGSPSPAGMFSGVGLLGSHSNYFVGNNPTGWHTDVANYSGVVQHNIYPGIDAQYSGAAGQLRMDLVVHPGGNAA